MRSLLAKYSVRAHLDAEPYLPMRAALRQARYRAAMNLRVIAAVALVLTLGACSKKSSPTTPEPDPQSGGCDMVADRTITLLQQDGEVDADRAGELRDVVVGLCTDDEWPEAARACMLEAGDHKKLEDCAHQFLSDEAYRRAGNEMARVLDDSADGQVGLPPE